MLSLAKLSYKIGARTIINETNLNIMDNWKVGIVGVNGAGKSTLFKLIAGDLKPDGGSVSLSSAQRMGIVRQDIPETDTPLIDLVLAANHEMTRLWKEAETQLDPNTLSDIYQKLADMDAYAAPAKAAILLKGLGFQEHQLTEPFSSFSGGWRMRVALAAALFVEPEVLLLDEPTNHLDLEAIMWLENYLISYPHTLLIISHDRDLLNKCIDHVVHIDKGDLTLYTGNYDTFERERAMRLGQQQKMHDKQQAERAHMQAFVDRFKAKASKARQAQSRMKALAKMDIVDAVIAGRAVHFNFPSPDGKIASPMLSIQHADIGYVRDKPVLRSIYENIDRDDRIALLGTNGNGKSTLMKLIAGRLDPMTGDVQRASKLRIGYFSQHQTEELDLDSTPYDELRKLMIKENPDVKEHGVRAKLGAFGFGRDLADNRIGALSGGEKARLLFAFMSFHSPHLLLLDEPTNHLDIDAREALVRALNDYDGAIVIVSHDPTIVERVADRLWIVRDGTVDNFDGDLDDYRQYIVQRARETRKNERKAKEKSEQPKATPQKTSRSTTLKRSQSAIEADIERLTTQKEKLESRMADPDLYKDPRKAQALKIDYDRLCADLEQCEADFLAA